MVSIKGLNPPKAQVNLSSIAGLDGSKFNSSKLGTRNIVIMLKLNGNVEQNRINLYQFFPTKENIKFYYKNGTRDVYIEGYVESVEVDLFSSKEQMQISIVCPQPYFKSVEEIVADISNVLAAFEFPFSINIGSPIPFSTFNRASVTNVVNDSESETGLIIDIDVLDSINSIVIRNTKNGDSISLSYAFQANDRVTINTNKGNKSITLLRNGVTYNIFNSLQSGSKFFQLDIGDNYFGYLIDNGAMNNAVYIVFHYYNTYRGV